MSTKITNYVKFFAAGIFGYAAAAQTSAAFNIPSCFFALLFGFLLIYFEDYPVQGTGWLKKLPPLAFVVIMLALFVAYTHYPVLACVLQAFVGAFWGITVVELVLGAFRRKATANLKAASFAEEAESFSGTTSVPTAGLLAWIIHILVASLMGWFVGSILIPGSILALTGLVLPLAAKLPLGIGIGVFYLYAFRAGVDTAFPFRNGGWL
jgi:hypothetical protein